MVSNLSLKHRTRGLKDTTSMLHFSFMLLYISTLVFVLSTPFVFTTYCSFHHLSSVSLFKIMLLLKIDKLFKTPLGFAGKDIIKEMKTDCFLQLVKRKHC